MAPDPGLRQEAYRLNRDRDSGAMRRYTRSRWFPGKALLLDAKLAKDAKHAKFFSKRIFLGGRGVLGGLGVKKLHTP